MSAFQPSFGLIVVIVMMIMIASLLAQKKKIPIAIFETKNTIQNGIAAVVVDPWV